MFPKYEEVITPLLVELVKRGGQSAPTDRDDQGRTVYEALADHFGLTAEDRSRLTDDGERRSYWENMVRRARQKHFDDGFLVSPIRGVWQLTQPWDRFLSKLPSATLVNKPGNFNGYHAFESKLRLRLHRSHERSRGLVERKKASVLKSKGRLDCEVCSFNFEDNYGPRGRGFAECHHRTPVSKLLPGQITRLSDLAIVCANSHRMIHRARPWLTIEGLRDRLHPANRA